jgi:hypothetical protein
MEMIVMLAAATAISFRSAKLKLLQELKYE